MPLRPDSRIASSGRHPDLEAGGHIGSRGRFDRAVAEANELAKLARMSPPETPPASREYAGIEDAVAFLGLPASAEVVARNTVRDVLEDTRDLLDVAKSAREGGIPAPAIQELIRVGLSMRYRRDRVLNKGGALPEGTTRKWGSREFVKVSGKWVPKGSGAHQAQQDDPKKKREGQVGKMRQQSQEAKAKAQSAKPAGSQFQAGGSGGAAASPKGGGPSGQSGSGAEGAGDAPSAPKPDRHVEPKARFKNIRAKAKAAGKTIHGDYNEEVHTHEHLDELEHQLARHIAEGLDRKHGGEALGGEAGGEVPEAGGPPGAGDAGPPQGEGGPAAGAPAEAEAPKDSAGRPTGHDSPTQPHEAARQQQGAHDLMDRLAGVKDRLSSPHMRGLHDELMADGKKVVKDPSPQANEWYRQRVLSFLVIATGAALGAAAGDPGGALAGGVHGKQTKVTPGKPSAVMETARRAGQAVTGGSTEPKPKPKKDEGKPVAKAAIMLTKSGRLVWKAEDEESEEEEEEDPAAAEAAEEEAEAGGGDDDEDEDLGKARGRVPPPPPPPKGQVLGVRVRKAAEHPSGGGWQPVPKGKQGGYRRRKGGKWEYWYPGQGDSKPRIRDAPLAVQPALATLALADKLHAALTPPKKVAERIWHGVVHTAKEFPAAARAMGKILDGESLDRHEMEAVVSVATMVGTAALAATTYGAAAGAGAGAKKFVTHVALAALSSHLNTAYTGYAALGFGKKLSAFIDHAAAHGGVAAQVAGAVLKAETSPTHEAAVKRLVEGVVSGMRSELVKRKGAMSKARPALHKGARAPHPKNAYGHRDDLEPGMELIPRDRHRGSGRVRVLDDGRFEMGDQIYKGGHALLTALHGSPRHKTTIRRYFRLGGEGRPVPQVNVLEPLRALVKAAGVLVTQTTRGYALTGDLTKAGVPGELLDESSSRHIELDHSSALNLCRKLAAST